MSRRIVTVYNLLAEEGASVNISKESFLKRKVVVDTDKYFYRSICYFWQVNSCLLEAYKSLKLSNGC